MRERETELARVQQIGRIGGLEVDLRTGFRNRRSPEYLLIHGLPPEAVDESHEDWVRRIHPEDREATEKKFRDAVASEVRDYTVQYRIVRPSDGETRWIAVRSTIERDADRQAAAAGRRAHATSPSRWSPSTRCGRARSGTAPSPTSSPN